MSTMSTVNNSGESFEPSSASLDAIMDGRPSDFTHIIRRYSNFGPSGGETSKPNNERRKSAAGGRRLSGRTGSAVTSSRTRVASSSTGSAMGRNVGRNGATRGGGSKGGLGRGKGGTSGPGTKDGAKSATSVTPSEDTVKPPDVDKLKVLEEENSLLKQRVAMLEAVHAVDAEDTDKLGRFRIRMLKAQNVQLEHQLVMVSSSAAQLGNLKGQMSTALEEMKGKIAEFKALQPLPLPKQDPPSEKPQFQRRNSLPSRLPAGSSSPSISSSRTPFSTSSSRSTSFASSLRNTSPASKSTAFSSQRGRPSSPSSRTSPRGRSISQEALDPDGEPAPKVPAPAPVPKVAVRKDWLETFEAWADEALARIDRSPLGKNGKSEKSEEGAEEMEGGDGSMRKVLSELSLQPFVPSGGNRFVVRDSDGQSVADISVNIAHILEGNKALVEYGRVHELESRLGNLHPRLLTIANLMASIIFPSLPAETSSAILQEMNMTVADLFDVTRALAELAVLLPAGVQLLGSGPAKSAKELAQLHHAELERKSLQNGIQFEDGDQGNVSFGRFSLGGNGMGGSGGGGLSGGGALSSQHMGEATSEVPSVEEVLAGLPQFESTKDERISRHYLEALLQKFTHMEAMWHVEMKGLQEEMAFYRGCHAAQASHVKQVLSAARGVLESILGDSFHVTSAAADAIKRVLDAEAEFENGPTHESMQHLAAVVREEVTSLKQFIDLLPQNVVANTKADSILDPLEREFKDRMQGVFENLQSRRASISRQRSSIGSSRQLNGFPSSNSLQR